MNDRSLESNQGNSLEQLRTLEAEDKYVFHGTGKILEEFEPKQAYTLLNEEPVPDGKPAVFASRELDVAMFMSIFTKENCPNGLRSGYDVQNGKARFEATKKTLDQINSESSGWVYVFDREDFEKRNGTEWVSYKNVKPLFRVPVKFSDFKPEIEIISEKY